MVPGPEASNCFHIPRVYIGEVPLMTSVIAPFYYTFKELTFTRLLDPNFQLTHCSLIYLAARNFAKLLRISDSLAVPVLE